MIPAGTVLVLGCGGIGAYLGGLLAVQGRAVTFVVRGPHGQALRERGLTLETTHGSFTPSIRYVTSLGEVREPPELVLLCVKFYDLEETARQIRVELGSSPVVLSIQNGLENLDLLVRVIDPTRLVGGVVWGTDSHVVSPGVVRQTGERPRLIVGGPSGSGTILAERAVQSFQGTGIEVSVVENFRAAQWEKLATLAAMSSVGCVLRSPLGPIVSTPATWQLLSRAIDEALRVAAAHQIPLETTWIQRVFEFGHRNPSWKSSMLRDLERGKRLEVDALSGSIVRAGQQVGVPTPVHQFLCEALSLASSGHQ